MASETDPFVQNRERLGDEHIQAWEQTIEETKLLADERREDGWETTVVMAPHTDTVSRDMKSHDRFGLMHVLPNNYADDFREAFDDEAFTEYLVYGSAIEGVMYVAIELIDPEGERSILVPCKYDMTMAEGMTKSALDEGALYSYFKLISGEILGRFRYEEFEPLVTPPDGAATSGTTGPTDT
jgi:hypothetical protein